MFLLFGAAIAALDLIWKVDLRAFATGFAMKQSLIIVVLAGFIIVGCGMAVAGREALFAVPSLLIATAVVRARRANRNEVQ
jgi:tagatose-1,6-bisphosphate aldolase non-catalytic subunit AgaZ/GatZ